MSELDAVFELLNRWRHLPAYQLERRADIFFALYLPAVLGEVMGTPVEERLIPEFPLKQLAMKSSDKVDYLALSCDRTRAFFIELKTDNASVNEKQLQYLLAAKESGLESKLQDLKLIVDRNASKAARQKYYCLFRELEALGLLKLPPGLKERVYSAHSKGVFEQFSAVDVSSCPPLEVVYVVPRLDEGSRLSSAEVTCITFDRFAECLERIGEPLASKLAEMLRVWGRTAAGESF